MKGNGQRLTVFYGEGLNFFGALYSLDLLIRLNKYLPEILPVQKRWQDNYIYPKVSNKEH